MSEREESRHSYFQDDAGGEEQSGILRLKAENDPDGSGGNGAGDNPGNH